ncbi:hypothetical protein [Pseudomonas sp. WS 5111]|uniref:hypothetical protein n=1 Tax=Pseudomonas sp. WS 5111 TaxID=2717493 RepID=UPI0014728109|nr:hypothetical protein [Pseudomonas sp. WS 5111]
MNQQRWNEQVETVVNTHSEAIDELREFQRHLEVDKGANALMQMHERQMASAGTYINLILVAGYAGFFGLWSTLSPKLPPRLYALCGLLAVLSLVLFIAWEVVKMIWSNIHMSRTSAMIQNMSGPELIQRFIASSQLFQVRSQRVWWFFLVPSVLSGLAAGSLLMWIFCYQLWQAFQ